MIRARVCVCMGWRRPYGFRQAGVFVLALGLLAAAGCSKAPSGKLEVSGQLEGIGVDAGTLVGGRVEAVYADEGDAVKAGDVLVKIEAHQAEAMVAAARAQLAQTEAVLAKLEAGARVEQIRQAEAAAAQAEEQYRMALKGSRSQEIDAARAATEAAQAQRDEARAEYGRVERLKEQDVVSQQVYDKAKHALDAAEAQYRGAQERLDMVVQGARSEEVNMAKAGFDRAAAMLDELRNGARAEDVAAAAAARDAARADLALAESKAREMTVTSPCDGIVESIDIHPGDIVKPGAIVRLIDPNKLELMVYVSPVVMGLLKRGQRVELTMDSFGAETFEGEVVQIANEGEYTPRNLQTQEARARQMFGIKLSLDSVGGRLKAGMTATAHIDLAGNAAG